MEVGRIEEMIQLLLKEHYHVFIVMVVALAFVWKWQPWRRQQKQEDPAETHNESIATAGLQSKTSRMQLRGNLRNELYILQSENEELQILVLQLRTEMEWKDVQFSEALVGSPTHVLVAAKNKHTCISTRLASEFEILGSCWALLIFGLCLITSKRQRRITKWHCHPIQRTIKTVPEHSSMMNDYIRRVAFPILSKNAKIAAQQIHAHVTSNETVIGRAIEENKIIPVAIHIRSLFTQNMQLLISTILAVELPEAKGNETFTNVIKELEQQLCESKDSLLGEEKSRHALEYKLERLEGALEGKEGLLYDERMKTRIWKLRYAELKLEWEEARQSEAKKQQDAAMSAVAEDRKRLLCGFLEEYMRCRQQQQEIRILNATNNKSNIFLPVPILQGISAARYNHSSSSSNINSKDDLNNLSDLYNQYSTPSERETRFCDMTCRDDVDSKESCYNMPQHEQDRRDESNEGYHVFNRLEQQKAKDNNNDRLGVVQERFLQSRSTPQTRWPVTNNSALTRAATRPIHWNNNNFHRQPLLSPFLMAANSAAKRTEHLGIRPFLKGNGGTTNMAEVTPLPPLGCQRLNE